MRFIDNGIEAQLDCTSIKECNKAMEISCRICTSRGINIPCDRCRIQTTHDQLVAAFVDLEIEKKKTREKEMLEYHKEQAKLKEKTYKALDEMDAKRDAYVERGNVNQLNGYRHEFYKLIDEIIDNMDRG